MLKRHGYRQSVADIANRIHPIEQSFDETIELQASLLAATPAARLRAGLQPCVTQGVLERMSAAISTTVQARGEFVEAHKAFAAIYDDIGIEVTDTGSGVGCPDKNFLESATADLRAVA